MTQPKRPELKRDQLKCGECGCARFELFHLQPEGECHVGGQGSGGFVGQLVAVCFKCKQEATIKAAPARLNTEDPLCGGWSKEEPSDAG